MESHVGGSGEDAVRGRHVLRDAQHEQAVSESRTGGTIHDKNLPSECEKVRSRYGKVVQGYYQVGMDEQFQSR